MKKVEISVFDMAYLTIDFEKSFNCLLFDSALIVSKNSNAYFCYSLGQLNYLSLLKYCVILIGNSSSGIIEAPSFKKPSINIGNRQRGRIKAISVIDCKPEKSKIISAIKKALSVKFQNQIKKCKNPYDKGNSSKKIIKIIEKLNINSVKSDFFDVKFKF